uniref:Secreted protein n=1 Tax=Setaria italica TaxID=4555 RepID=K3ZAS0_SETIT
MWVLPLGVFAVPASSSVEPSVDGQGSARRVLLGFVSGGCRSSNTAGEFSLNFVVLLLFCERVGDLGIPAGLSVWVAVAGNPGLLFPSVAADLWSSFSWRSDGRCAITEIEASRRVPGVGSCGLTKA